MIKCENKDCCYSVGENGNCFVSDWKCTMRILSSKIAEKMVKDKIQLIKDYKEAVEEIIKNRSYYGAKQCSANNFDIELKTKLSAINDILQMLEEEL
jgi:hypothetical protein